MFRERILSLLLLLIVTVAPAAAAAAECEVCVKVMEDVRATLTKEEARDKVKIEEALATYCQDSEDAKATKLKSKERKICYYISPIKKQVSQPFSTGMPSLKVCKRISQSNPDICSVKFPLKTNNLEKKDISKMRVKQLKSILASRGVECKGCVEKEEFIAKVQETEHLAVDEEL